MNLKKISEQVQLNDIMLKNRVVASLHGTIMNAHQFLEKVPESIIKDDKP